MITIFTIPKAFQGHIGVIQRNAIQSWRALEPACQIILAGNDPGTAETAAEFGLEHIPDVALNDFGTPLLSDAFARVEAAARHRLVCYINADIILLPEFLRAVEAIHFRRLLMVGSRWDVDITASIDFGKESWADEVKRLVHERGRLHPPSGSDYFVFVKHSLGKLPDFAVGRPGWDNWMIYHARRSGIPVVDASRSMMVVHQNHDYRHVANRYQQSGYYGPEADRNFEIMGGKRSLFILQDSTHLLVNFKLKPALTRDHLMRRIRTLAALHPKLRPAADLIKWCVRTFSLNKN